MRGVRGRGAGRRGASRGARGAPPAARRPARSPRGALVLARRARRPCRAARAPAVRPRSRRRAAPSPAARAPSAASSPAGSAPRRLGPATAGRRGGKGLALRGCVGWGRGALQPPRGGAYLLHLLYADERAGARDLLHPRVRLCARNDLRPDLDPVDPVGHPPRLCLRSCAARRGRRCIGGGRGGPRRAAKRTASRVRPRPYPGVLGAPLRPSARWNRRRRSCRVALAPRGRAGCRGGGAAGRRERRGPPARQGPDMAICVTHSEARTEEQDPGEQRPHSSPTMRL